MMRGRVALSGLVCLAMSCSSKHEEAPDGGVSSQELDHLAPLGRALPVARLHRDLAAAVAPNVDGVRADGERFSTHGHRVGTDGSLMGGVFPAFADAAMKLGPARIERWSARLSPVGAKHSAATLDEGRLVYEGAWPSTDLLVTSGKRSVEWLLVLADEKAPSSFAWEMSLGSDLRVDPLPLRDGSIDLVDGHGDAALRVHPAFAVDAKGTRRDVRIAIAGGRLLLSLDRSGLAYPIVVDPVVSVPVWQRVLKTTDTGGYPTHLGASGAWLGDASTGVGLAIGGETTLPDTITKDLYSWNGTQWAGGGTYPVAGAFVSAANASNGHVYTWGGCSDTKCQYPSGAQVYELAPGLGWAGFCTSSACGPFGSREGPGIAAAGSQLLLYGGGIYQPGTNDYQLWSDLWAVDLSGSARTFTNISLANIPTARRNMTFVGQPNGSNVLMFGGVASGKNELYGDTWVYKKSGATTGAMQCVCSCTTTTPPVGPCNDSPSPRAFSASAWDDARKRFVVFGGWTQFGDAYGASKGTYEFDPSTSTWNVLCAEGGPDGCTGVDPTEGGGAFYDPIRRRVMLFGGTGNINGTYSPGDTFALYVRGGSCSSDSDCDTGHCVESTCCTTASCPTCQTCADPSNIGVCTNVGVGKPDTLGRCDACDGTGVCKKALGIACSAGSECASSYCVNSTCCNQSACGGGTSCANSTGTCLKVAGSACTKNAECITGFCTDGVCCGVATCGTGARCDFAGANGACKKVQGQACTAATDCGTGFCADGYCCNSACTDQCAACDVVKGTCGPVTGTVHGTRTACAGSGSCKALCNGSDTTACHYPGVGVTCGALSCSGTTETDPSTCDGAGGCIPNTKSCGAFVCGATSCKNTCASNTDCNAGYYCKSGTCSPKEINGTSCTVGGAASCATGNCVDGVCCATATCASGAKCSVVGSLGTCAKPLGIACTGASECGSGFCIDGVCCDTACTGQCQACDTTGKVGTCSIVSGSPHGSRPACSGTGVGTECGPTCNGDAFACKYPNGTKSCGAATCVSEVETHVSVCNGAGSCSDTPKVCNGFKCGTNACKTSCTANTDCVTGYYCKSGACIPIEGLGTACTDASTCTSGFCTDGVCCAVGSCGAGKSCSAGTTKGVCTSLGGTACKADAECASGACTDGVCCDSRCNGPCEACNQVGSIGKCVPIVGTPLTGHPSCGAIGDPTCGLRCDGTDGKNCKYAGMTESCGAPGCAGTTETDVGTCNGAGSCNVMTKSCGTYGCGTTACLTTCTKTDDCADATYYCKAGSCVKRELAGVACSMGTDCASGNCVDGVCCTLSACEAGKSCGAASSSKPGECIAKNGVACTAAGDCASGNCVDGVCCDTACNGQCEACNLTASPGTCTPVVGDPVAPRTACDDKMATDCAKAQCDGKVRDKCNGFKNGGTVSCGAASCTKDKKFQKAGVCDGAGGCTYPDAKPCTPYACDTTSLNGCKSSCAGDGDCADGFTCLGGACVQGATCSDDKLSSVDKSGTPTSCTPYKCGSDGLCLKSCGTSDDCAPDTVCDTNVKACVANAPSTESSGGCSTSFGRTSGSSALGLLVLVGLALRRRTGS